MFLFINPTPDKSFYDGLKKFDLQECFRVLNLQELWLKKGHFRLEETVKHLLQTLDDREILKIVFWGSSYVWSQQFRQFDFYQVQFLFWGNDLVEEWLKPTRYQVHKLLVHSSQKLLKDYLSQLLTRNSSLKLEQIKLAWKNSDKYFKAFLIEYCELRSEFTERDVLSRTLASAYSKRHAAPAYLGLLDKEQTTLLESRLLNPDYPLQEDWAALLGTTQSSSRF